MVPGVGAVPTYTTKRTDRPTRGSTIEAASLLIGRVPFMAHQRHIADVANEIDPATGLLWYDTIVVVMPRQQGKTTLLEPSLVAAALRRPDIDVVYTAQDRQMSKRRLIDELADKRLARRPELSGQFKVRRSNGSEAIRWGNGSQITTVANTDQAGHGLTLDLAVLDEAFSHDDLTVVTALEPTTVTRPDPQVWIVSTVGDGTDGLLQHFQEIGQTSLTDPASRVAYFEWSATDDDDRDDPAVWARVMPALGTTIAAERIRSRRANLTPEVFDRSYLCRRPSFEDHAKLPADAWTDCRSPAELAPVAPFVVALSVSQDRGSVAVAVAGTDRGRTAVVVDTLSGSSSAVSDEILAIYYRLGAGAAVIADRRAGAGSLIDALGLLGLPVEELGTAQIVTATGTFYDAVTDRELWHDSQARLDAAAAVAVSRPLGEAWAWDARRSPGDVSPLIAATNAVGAHRSRFGLSPVHSAIQ